MIYQKKCVAIALIAFSLITQSPNLVEAKILSGSITEKKQIAKVSKMLNSARKYVSKGKNQDAINLYWKILEIDANEPYAYLELGEIYKKLRIYDRSIEMLTSGLDIGKDFLDSDTICNYYCILTEVYTSTNQQGLANKSLIKAAEIAPRNPLPRKILGDIYLKNNRVANAAKAYKKALELDLYYEPAKTALDKIKQEYGDKLPKEDKDKDYIKKVAVKLSPKNNKQSENINITQNNTEKANENKETSNNQVVLSSELPKSNQKSSQKSDNQQNIASEELEINEQQISEEVTLNNSETLSDSRPLPLEPEEIAKLDKERNKKRKSKKKPQTAEEIEIAMKEKENVVQSQNKDNSNEQYIDMFLSGNPTEKEEALNHFINKGKEGLSQIEELIYDSNPNVRILAIRALPLFDDFKDDVKSILQDASDDNDPEVVEEINKALNLL